MKTLLPLAIIGLCAATHATAKPGVEVVMASDVTWDHLNPARGDQSPSAGTLWGDRNGTEPTGYLLKPSEGFQSPPHIHNVSYRGLVIRGQFHNDDPNADNMWMPTGSFWTQPKGAVHITAAQGKDALAYIEIDEGPYLVKPVEQAFHTDEEPVNVAPSNLVWLDASSLNWVAATTPAAADVQMTFLWGHPQDHQLNGSLIRLPAGFSGTLRSQGEELKVVVIEGQTDHLAKGKTKRQSLTPGSYFGSEGNITHQIQTRQPSMLYLRSRGRFVVTSE